MTLDIRNKEQMSGILGRLKSDATPLWGKMGPQHVVEHLSNLIKISTGKKEVQQVTTKEEAEKIKAVLINSDAPIPQGIKSPLLGDEPPAFRFGNLLEAVEELHKELEHFQDYYGNNPTSSHMHPRMGKLNGQEWLTLHNKHFTHHFKQYGLL